MSLEDGLTRMWNDGDCVGARVGDVWNQAGNRASGL